MDKLKRQIRDALSGIQIDFGGGCSASKGYLMAWLIKRYQINSSIDIGVYRGRSLVPQAICHREFTGGKAYGVDPWSKIEARETNNPVLRAAIDRFIDATDFAAIHAEVGILIQRLGLEKNCQLLRETSFGAIRYFEREGIMFGLIHIDGNHDTDRVMADISLYLPRLSSGGFVVIDDVSWDSIKPAYSALSMRLRKIYQNQDASNDYAVFWDAPSWAAARVLNARLTFVGRE